MTNQTVPGDAKPDETDAAIEAKKIAERELAGARFDLIETGGGAASSTVISPKIFEEFVLPGFGGDVVDNFRGIVDVDDLYCEIEVPVPVHVRECRVHMM